MNIIEKLIQDAKLVPKTIVYKLRHEIKLTETEWEEVYNNPKLAYEYALCSKDVPEVNIVKLEKIVLSSPEYSCWFAKNVPGANIVKLENAVLKSPEYSYYFVRNIPKANITKLEESIKKDKYWWKIYKIWWCRYKSLLVTT